MTYSLRLKPEVSGVFSKYKRHQRFAGAFLLSFQRFLSEYDYCARKRRALLRLIEMEPTAFWIHLSLMCLSSISVAKPLPLQTSLILSVYSQKKRNAQSGSSSIVLFRVRCRTAFLIREAEAWCLGTIPFYSEMMKSAQMLKANKSSFQAALEQ